jgi:hypothetical protein
MQPLKCGKLFGKDRLTAEASYNTRAITSSCEHKGISETFCLRARSLRESVPKFR